MNVPVQVEPGAGLTQRQQDYLRLTAFVLAQHGKFDRAETLLAALCVAGGASLQVLLSRAVLNFQLGEYSAALELLDTVDLRDPIERFGTRELSEEHKLRRYLRARCYRETGSMAKASDAVDIYLRRKGRPAE